jgi:hypothetical protein
VTDGASWIASEGVPYAFESFEARTPTKPGEPPAAAVKRTKQLPTEKEMVTFP